MNRRVLLADDNRDAAESLAILLHLEGFDTRIAYDGATALQLLGEFQPHVVLLDIGMPDIDGYEVARRIAAADGSSAVILIAITGWGQQADIERAKAAGFHGHFTKPIELDDVLAFVEKHRSTS